MSDDQPQAEMSEADAKKCAAKLKQLLDKSNQGDRKVFMDNFKDIRSYGYDNDGNTKKMYSGWDLQENDFQASINRVAEYVELFGSHLYPQNPDASVVTQRSVDQWSDQRNKLESDMLDYFMRVGELETSTRRTLNEALVGGRGMLWFGWNDRKKIPYAVFDTVENYGCDPDAKCPEEMNWVRRRRTKPRFELKRSIPTDPQTGKSVALFDVSELKGTGDQGDIIEYHEFYFRTGIHNYCTMAADQESDQGAQAQFDDSPMKYVFAEERLLYKTEWEIPFFKIDAWPCRILDFRLQPEKLWPVSTLQPVLCHVKAMNWIYTAYLNRIKRTWRQRFARVKVKGVQMGDQALESAMGMGGSNDGGEGSVIDVEIPNGMTDPDVRKLLQSLTMDTDMPGFEKAFGIVNRMFEDGSGLNDLIRSGQDTNQLRTAADVDFKKSRSMTRVDDMGKQFQVFFDSVIYSLAFTARFLMNPQEVAQLFGKEAGALYGDLGDDQMKQQDEMLRMQAANGEMQKAVQGAQGMMQQAVQMTGQVPVEPPPMPSAEEIETKLGPPRIVTIDDWIYSASRQIVAGSMRTVDHEAQTSNLSFYFQTMAPMVAATPPGQALNAEMIELFMRLNRYDAEAVSAAQKYKSSMEQISAFQTQMMLNPPPPPGAPAPGTNPPRPGPEPTQGREQAVLGQNQ